MENPKKKLSYRIPPRFLLELGVGQASIDCQALSHSFACVGTIFYNQAEIASMYEYTEQVNGADNISKRIETIKERLEIRRQLLLPFLPEIYDYDIQQNENSITVSVLLEYLGKSISQWSRESPSTYIDNVPYWFFYTVRSLYYLNKANWNFKFISPEEIYLTKSSLKFLDFNGLMANSGSENNFGPSRVTWKSGKCFKTSIVCPKPFFRQSDPETNISKIQLYFVAVYFYMLLAGEEFAQKLNKTIKKEPYLARNIPKLLRSQQRKIKKRVASYFWLDKFFLLLSSSIRFCPNLCPTLKQMYKLKEIETNLFKKCTNCKAQFGNFICIANCTKAEICQKCAVNSECTMCLVPHKIAAPTQRSLTLSTDYQASSPWAHSLRLIYVNSPKILDLPQCKHLVFCELAYAKEGLSLKIREGEEEVWVPARSEMVLKEGTEFKLGKTTYKVIDLNAKKRLFTLLEDTKTKLEISEGMHKILTKRDGREEVGALLVLESTAAPELQLFLLNGTP